MQQWEYKVCQITYNSGEGLERAMNQLGQEGWELSELIPVNDTHIGAAHCVFKRPRAIELRPVEFGAMSSCVLTMTEEEKQARAKELMEMLVRVASGNRFGFMPQGIPLTEEEQQEAIAKASMAKWAE